MVMEWVGRLLQSFPSKNVVHCEEMGEVAQREINGNDSNSTENKSSTDDVVVGQNFAAMFGQNPIIPFSFTTQHTERGIVKTEDGKTLKLKQVQTYFRHGARTPCHVPPPKVEEVEWDKQMCDAFSAFQRKMVVMGPNWSPQPLNKFNFMQNLKLLKGGCSQGQLTKVGVDDALKLGQRLRETYFDALGLNEDEINELIHIQSTNYYRTIQSARMVASGLFGYHGERAYIMVLPLDEEFLFPNKFSCPRIEEMFKENLRIHRQTTKDKMRGEVAKDLGLKREKVYYTGIYDVLVSRKYHGKHVPEIMLKHEQTLHDGAVGEVLGRFEHAPFESISLSYGVLFQNLLRTFDDCVDEKPTKKMYLYSCHDTTILPLLVFFNAFDKPEWPPYSSELIFELYQDQENEKEWYVRLLYRGSVYKLHGKEYFSYEDFSVWLRKFIPENFKNACKLRAKAKKEGTPFL
eukprot:m.15541 g.15541  ORF g.15541 m.15541 type:complete len:461 (-) comp4489_c0_seq1:1167-2549(-)